MPSEPSDWAILFLVTAARLLLPLLIPRYPLPAILASLLLDGIDQSLFQQFTTLSLAGYQSYDKALDIFYLTMAYISTLRNWENLFAVQIARFLFYWRLVGVALFEVTGERWLLPIFANVFEYYFIFYEVCRLRWDPRRLPRRLLVGAAVLIWAVVKLPQEYWLHIARLDTTDWVKTRLLGQPLDLPWSRILARQPGLLLAGLAALGLALLAAWWLAGHRLPPPDHPLTLQADARRPAFGPEQVRAARHKEARQIMDAALLEKVVLIGLVSISFAHVIPGLRASDVQLAAGLAVVVTLNTALTHWALRRGLSWAMTVRQLLVVGSVNSLLALGYVALRPALYDWLALANALFMALLLSLLVTLFDRYRLAYLIRWLALLVLCLPVLAGCAPLPAREASPVVTESPSAGAVRLTALPAGCEEGALSSTVCLPLVSHQPTPAQADWWRPPVGITWQWQLSGLPLDLGVDAEVYDVDLFETEAGSVAALHAAGRRAICYISAGSWEDWRPDADRFPPEVLGNDYEGWPGEKWLDIRRIDLLAPIMGARLDQCRDKGFDGVEPDNIDGYTNDTGFALTYQDQIAYNLWLAGAAHERGLSIGLKNDDEQVADLLPYYDWALTEDCFVQGWCEALAPFVVAGKAVLAAEYTDEMTGDQFLTQVCAQTQAPAQGFSAILKHRDLDAWRQSCP